MALSASDAAIDKASVCPKAQSFATTRTTATLTDIRPADMFSLWSRSMRPILTGLSG